MNRNNSDRSGDEVSRALGYFGMYASELRRLEEASRMFQEMEWKLARRNLARAQSAKAEA